VGVCGGGLYGIICIKDTYVVCKYFKKTVLEQGFRHLPGQDRRSAAGGDGDGPGCHGAQGGDAPKCVYRRR
jgi:hypothetical protein